MTEPCTKPRTEPRATAPRFTQVHQPDGQALAAEAAAGLLDKAARVSPKFFYDALGSRLFDAITELPEYYPTRTEAAILQQHLGAITDAVVGAAGPAPSIVDLGAGSCAKAAKLFAALKPARYVAVDISVDYLRDAVTSLQREHPGIQMMGLGLDFSARLSLPADVMNGEPALVFYPGSSIGNFAPAQALRLLREAHALAAGGALLIGVDMVKPAEILEPAYDDELGVTAAFNLNVLSNLNRLLGADFQPRGWQHVALFNEAESRIEMHLQARHSTDVRWPGAHRRFAAGERIHTESSVKWQPAAFESLLREAGFTSVRRFSDARGWFSVFVAC